MYSLIRSLVNPAEVVAKTYQEIKTLIIEHMSPKPTIYTQRFTFYRTMQKPLASNQQSLLVSTQLDYE